MKKIARLLIATIVFAMWISSITLAQWVVDKWNKSDEWISNNDSPVKLLQRIHYEANDDNGKVQVTPLNKVSSKDGGHCDVYTDSKFTLTRTLCSIKYFIKWYLQYITYIWLVAATIFIIRNWFKIVTATDKEGQMKKFKQNMINLIIWVILLTSFYFILDAFVSIVNFLAWDTLS